MRWASMPLTSNQSFPPPRMRPQAGWEAGSDSCLFDIRQPKGVLRLQHLVIVLHHTDDTADNSSSTGATAAATPRSSSWLPWASEPEQPAPELSSLDRMRRAFQW